MQREEGVARRRPPVKDAHSSAELSGLSLETLRAYRAALSAEEDKVSYWRRLLHGRLDLLEARASVEGTLSVADLVRVLGDTGSGQSRRMLMRIPAAVGLPDLPDSADLAQLWTVDPHSIDEIADVVKRLRVEASRLSDYRGALHERLDAATGELIMRYRADPSAALVLLPRQ